MKTTVNLPDELLRAAQEVARREGTTLRELIETGLRATLRQRSAQADFRLPDASVDGQGLRPEFQDAEWGRLRDTSYGTTP